MDQITTADLTLFVRNLHPDVTEALLYELFLQAGPISQVALKNNFAFVTYEDPESIPYAVALLTDTPLFGQPIEVKPRQGSCFEHIWLKTLPPSCQSLAKAETERRREAEFRRQQSLTLLPTPMMAPPMLPPGYMPNQQYGLHHSMSYPADMYYQNNQFSHSHHSSWEEFHPTPQRDTRDNYSSHRYGQESQQSSRYNSHESSRSVHQSEYSRHHSHNSDRDNHHHSSSSSANKHHHHRSSHRH